MITREIIQAFGGRTVVSLKLRCLCTDRAVVAPRSTFDPSWFYSSSYLGPFSRDMCGPIGFAQAMNARFDATGNQ